MVYDDKNTKKKRMPISKAAKMVVHTFRVVHTSVDVDAIISQPPLPLLAQIQLASPG